MPSPFTSPAEWFATRRTALSRGGLWLDGREPGRPDPADFERARLRLLICRLSPYDDVETSITHRMLLCAARAVPGVYADLAFFPPETDAALLRRDGIPFWLASGAKRPPTDFDVVAISLSVQQEAFHLPVALQASGLRLDFAGRMADAAQPLIVLGGHGAGSAPFLHGDAGDEGSGGLVDAVCLGDGVAWLQEFLRRRLSARDAPAAKREFLAELARGLPGTYVPAFYRHRHAGERLVAIEPQLPDLPFPARHRQDPLDVWLKDYDGAYVPFSAEELEETLPLAVGCAYRCRFCQTGWLRGELSAAAERALAQAARRCKARLVNADLNLLASDACSVPGLEKILDALCPLFRRASVKSLSVASLVRRPESFRLLRRLAKHEFTFGVEGISARLRAYLGKPATADDLLRIAGALAGGGLRQLKLFFIATGREEESDLAELARLLKSLRAQAPGCRLIASFMPLFHAPFTPLQFAPIRGPTPELVAALAAAVRQAGGEFRWSAYPDEIALMNRLCRAGRRATPALVQFSLHRGMRYYRRLDPVLIREMERALPADLGAKTPDDVLPWSDVQAAASPATLWRSYQQACREWEAAPASAAAGNRPAARGAPGAEAPPPAPERWHFWLRIPPEQAAHPDHVVVRGWFQNRFAGWPAGVAAYDGGPQLLRPAGAHGWALGSAEFKPGTRRPARGPFLDPADFAAPTEDAAFFELAWPTLAPAQAILARFKRDRIKFQTVRRGASRWHVVERAFRGRTGIAALREDETQTVLYCQRRPALPDDDPAFRALPAPEVRAVLIPSDAPCPACQGARLVPLKSDDGGKTPVCFDCLTKSGRT